MHTHRILSILTTLFVIAAPCFAEEHEHDEHEEHGNEEHQPTIVKRTASELAAFGVTVVTASAGKIDLGTELLGEVQPNGDTIAHIVPRFPGIALTVRKTVGDEVKNGEVLATIQSNESLAPYDLKTMTDGTVIEKHLTRGEAMERDKPAFVIADLSTVWVDLSVHQKDIHEISVGQPVRVSSHHVPDADGTISYIAPVVDQPTRTTIARLVLPNPNRVWRPGLFVTARVLESANAQVVVARTAIQTIEDRTVVFVETAEGFVPRPVVLGRAGESYVEVASGLSAGERYVATSSFLLKAELGKGAAEHDH